MDKDTALNIAKNYIREIQKKDYKIVKAFLFGSYANDTSIPESDIDIALF